MLAGGAGALLLGKLYDHAGLKVLVPVTIAGAFFAPLVFLGGYAYAVFGVMLWGLASGVHESVMSAAVADMIPAERRAGAYGVFTTVFGVAWFLAARWKARCMIIRLWCWWWWRWGRSCWRWRRC